MPANLFGKGRVGITRKDFDFPVDAHLDFGSRILDFGFQIQDKNPRSKIGNLKSKNGLPQNKRQSVLKIEIGWGGRTRTYECRIQR
ncbi:MAG TPA: hypothetical protein PLP21_18610, partial [Pyrinomonadaceae bacterium]|nr:hypothetical protein [Pyrinomonadaceae bacterium]